jgi:hypothetical protein
MVGEGRISYLVSASVFAGSRSHAEQVALGTALNGLGKAGGQAMNAMARFAARCRPIISKLLELPLQIMQHLIAWQHLRDRGIGFATLADRGDEFAVLKLNAIHRDCNL